MSATKKTPPKVDWSLAPRGAVSGTAQAAIGLVVLGGAGDIAHISPVLAGLGAGVGALSHVVATSVQGKYTPGAILYRLACWTGAGSWLAWALHNPHGAHGHNLHVFNHQGLAALAVGAVGAGLAAGPVGGQTRKRRALATAGGTAGAELVRSAGPLGLEWEARFKRVCNVKVQVTEIIRWANGAGYDVVGVLPPGPATRGRIESACEALATDARLPDGCGCEPKPPRPGSHRGEFVLAVSTVNRFGTRGDEHPPKIPYPADYSPRSILDPIPQGEHRDGTVAGVVLRENSKLIVGRKGGGKTNDLDVDTLGIARCRDALTWHIDLNGGGMSQFWLEPWLNGETDRPVIDWAASTPEEALYMVTLAVAIAKGRKSAYREFKAKANAKLLPVSEQLPEIVILMDEGAEALAPSNNDPITRQVRDRLAEIQRIGRNEAVNVVISSLRPTAGMLHPDLLNQSAIRVGTYGLSAADLGHLYDWAKGISMDDLPVKGTSFLGVMPDVPRPKKSWFLEPNQIKEAAVVVAGYRPDLDEASAEIANAEHSFNLGGIKPKALSNLYAGRYARMRAAFTGQTHQEEPATAPTTARPAATTVAARPAFQLLKGGADTSAKNWPDPFERQPQPATTTTVTSAKDWPDPIPGRQLHAATAPAGMLTAARPAAPAQPVPELVRRALAAFDDANDDRMHSETLARALGIGTAHDMAELLGLLEIKSLPRGFVRGGKERRGYAREDFAQAADRIASGELAVPEKVVAWPAA